MKRRLLGAEMSSESDVMAIAGDQRQSKPCDLKSVLAALPWKGAQPARMPPRRVDLRDFVGRSFDQGTDPLCTAMVVAGLAEYVHRRVHGGSREASVLFNYRTSRVVAGAPNRKGSFLGDALEAWSRFGLPTEESWPQTPGNMDVDPPAPVYDEALSWQQHRFVRIDSDGVTLQGYLDRLRATLAAELPVSLDFPLHLDLAQSFDSGTITQPREDSKIIGRHVVLLCGYDDERRTPDGGTGAFLLQNCWGTAWGEDGFGWLPYDFVRLGWARCSWTVAVTTTEQELAR